MTAKKFYQIFFTVRRCLICEEMLSPERIDEAFCEKCQTGWNSDTLTACPECFLPARECECMPRSLKKAGALTLRKLAFYMDEGDHKEVNSVIYWLKYKHNMRIANFVARELLPALNTELDALGLSNEDLVITHVPRGKASKISHGFDQSEMVCRQMSKQTKIKHLTLFKTSLSKDQQKDLNSKARMKHANDTISMKKKTDVKGKYVLLFDDIVTSGASMAVCTRQLMKNGAKGVICLCLASRG